VGSQDIHGKMLGGATLAESRTNISNKGSLNEAIMSFVRLHPGQYTNVRLAERVSDRSGLDRIELLDEINAMMGTQLSLSANRAVGVRQDRVSLSTSNPHTIH